jgi:hypothetical protein
MAESDVPNLASRLSTLSKLVGEDLAAIPDAPIVSQPAESEGEIEEAADGSDADPNVMLNTSSSQDDAGKEASNQSENTTGVIPSVQYTPPNPDAMMEAHLKKLQTARERKVAQRKYRRQFKRVQRYLGLRPRLDHRKSASRPHQVVGID